MAGGPALRGYGPNAADHSHDVEADTDGLGAYLHEVRQTELQIESEALRKL